MTRHWLELGNQWLEVTRKFLWLASDSTRKNFRWLWLEGLVTLTGQKWLGHITVHWYSSEVAVVTFSDSKSSPFLKFFNPVPGPDREILQIWKSDSCSDSSYHRCNQNLSMFFLKKWPSVQIPASAEIENCSRIWDWFFTNFWLRVRIPVWKKRRILLESILATRIHDPVLPGVRLEAIDPIC